jgi:hypothetical protein
VALLTNEKAPTERHDVSVSSASADGNQASGNIRWRYALPLIPWVWYLIRDLHSLLEYAAIALPVIVLGAAILSLALMVSRRSALWAATAASLTLFFCVAVFGPWRPIEAPAPVADESFRIASVNLGLYWFSDNDAGYYVHREAPDILIGAELSESHDEEFRRRFAFAAGDILPLARQQENELGLNPTTDNYRANGLPSLGVYSNFPFEVLDDPIADSFDGGLPGMRIRLEAPSGPIVVYALHVPRPSPDIGPYRLAPGDQLNLVDQIVDAVAAESDPVVVMGDLNAVDRTSAYRTLTSQLNDGMRQSGWAVPTADREFPWTLLFARIDHLLLSDGLCATDGASEETRFSDHRPLVANVGPCAPA